jgi:uncharacterized protein
VLLVDTNVWLAAADRSSNRHEACAKLIADPANEPASTVPVIAETAWLLLDRAGPDAQQRFLAAVATGQIAIIDLTAKDWTRVHELVAVYADASLDVIDASTIAAAERLNQTVIATLDERDFRIVRPNHTDAFDLLPGPA